jgi:hypothetical protein
MIEFRPSTRYLFDDVVGFRRPEKGAGIAIVSIDVFEDGLFEFGRAFEDATTHALVSDVPEEPFDHVEPRGAGGREVNMDSGAPRPPCFDFGMLVRCLVVADNVDRLLFGNAPFDEAQELQPVLVTVLVRAGADHVPGGDLQGPRRARWFRCLSSRASSSRNALS